MSFIQNFFTSRDNGANSVTYVGQTDRLWYDPITNTLRVSDGSTPGGLPVDLSIQADANINSLIVNTITSNTGTVGLIGNITISGNISPAGANKIGGIFPGPGVVIGTNGQLTIDSANLPVSFGNFFATNNILSIVNVNENMILETQGNAEIQLVGNIGFYQTDGAGVSGQFFSANKDGQVTFYIPTVDPTAGAVKIVGSTSGNFSAPINTGVMLHITGQNNDASRLYNDSIGSFAAFVGRRINGNIANPTAVQAGDEIIRISSTGYDGTSIPGSGTARIVYQAIENYTPTAKGSNLSLWTTPVASNVLTKVATIDNANGVNATKFTTSSTVSAAGNITGGNILTSGVVSTTGGLTSADGITSTGNIVIGNVIRYDQGTNNATASGFNKTGGTVTANGRTGQITSNADALSKNAAGTFTVNNNYITSAKDIVIVNIASGGTINSYTASVTAVNAAGSFQVTICNNGNGSLSEALVFNFAVIKVS